MLRDPARRRRPPGLGPGSSTGGAALRARPSTTAARASRPGRAPQRTPPRRDPPDAGGGVRPERVGPGARERQPSRPELAAGRGPRGPEEHGDRHRPDAAPPRRDGPRAVARGVRIDVAHEPGRLETGYSDGD